MSTKIVYIPNRVIDSDGIADAASISVYETGTSTPVSLFLDNDRVVPTTNPYLVASGAAVPSLYTDFVGDIRVRIVPVNGTPEDYDPYDPLGLAGLISGLTPNTPEQYGAVGDGIADDTTAVQTLLNSGTKWLYLPNTYAVTGLVLYNKSDITIFGRSNILMTGTPVNGTHVFSLIQCNNILVEGLTLNGQSETRGGVEGAQNLSIYGCTDMTFRNVQSLYSASDGLYINRAAGSAVVNGITMSSSSVVSSNIKFDTCKFDYAYRNGLSIIACEDPLFSNCVFSNTGMSTAGTTAPSAGVDLEPNDTVQYFPKRTMFQGCRFYNNTGSQATVNGRSYETTFDGCHMDTGTSYGLNNAGARTVIRGGIIKDSGAASRPIINNQSQTGSRASLTVDNVDLTGAVFGGIIQNSYSDLTIRNVKVSDGANFGLRLLAGSDPGDGNKGFTKVDSNLRIEKLFSSSPPANSAYIMGGSYDGRLYMNGVRLLRTGATGTPIEIGVNLATSPPTDVQEISDFNAVGAFATTTAAGFSIAKVLRNNQLDSAVSPLLNMTGSATYDPPSIAGALSATTTVTVTGAALGEKYAASFSLSLGGLILSAYVSATNTVTCVFSNPTAAPIDINSGTLSVSRLPV